MPDPHQVGQAELLPEVAQTSPVVAVARSRPVAAAVRTVPIVQVAEGCPERSSETGSRASEVGPVGGA